ncbi:adhesion G-protein coupled receptor D1, partial [Biomphalaria pfeifferi]
MMLLRRFVESSNYVGLLLCIIFKSINGNGQCPTIHWLSVSSTTCLAISTDFSKELMAWGQAVEACPEIHPMARLASFPTQVHFDLLASNLRPTVSYWVGLRTQKPVGGKVTWLDGTVDNTSHFYISRNQLQNELCCYVTVNQFSPYLDVTWTLDDCGIQLPYICQFEKENEYTTLGNHYNQTFRNRERIAQGVGVKNGASSVATDLTSAKQAASNSSYSEATKYKRNREMFSKSTSGVDNPEIEFKNTPTRSVTTQFPFDFNKDKFLWYKTLQDAFKVFIVFRTSNMNNVNHRPKHWTIQPKFTDSQQALYSGQRIHPLSRPKHLLYQRQSKDKRIIAVARNNRLQLRVKRLVQTHRNSEAGEKFKSVAKNDEIRNKLKLNAIGIQITNGGNKKGEMGDMQKLERLKRNEHIVSHSECCHGECGHSECHGECHNKGSSSHCNCKDCTTATHDLTDSSHTSLAGSLPTVSYPPKVSKGESSTEHKTLSTPEPVTSATAGITSSAPTSNLAQTTTAANTHQAQRPLPFTTTTNQPPIVNTGDKTTDKLKQILTTEEVSTTPTFENSTTDIPPDFQFREKIVTKMQCNTSSVENCLATVINMTSDSRMRNQNVMTSFYELLDDLSEMIGKGAVTQLVDDIQLYARILDVNLGFCQPYESSCTEKRKSDLLEKAELFTDNVVLSEDSDPDFKEFSFTLDQLDMFMVKSVYGAIRGRTLQMKSGVITIEDIAPSQQVNNSARIFVSAMIMHLPRSNVQFIHQSQDDLFDAALVSPVLTLKAYMEKSKVNVIHNFSLLAKSYENDSNVPVCAFQRANESNNPDGDVWDTKGCMVVEDQGSPASLAALGPLIDRSGGHHGHRHNLSALRQERVIGCHCNHTTNFAILMQTVEFQVKDTDALALSIITYIGCSVTLVTQIMAITVFTCIRSLNSERVCVHRNLCITIMMAQVTFIAGVTAVEDKVVCAVVAVALHYLYTATFVWMLVEGLHLYSQVVRVFGTEKSRILYYIFFGWGVPLVLVAISAAVDWDGYGNNRSCWLSIQRATIWAFVGPAIATILVNLVILILVLRIVITSSKVDKQDSMKNVRAGIKASLFLAPLLGLTWIFGLASVSEQLVAFQYIFAILNSLQGFFIFLFHCALNTEVRQALARLRERRSLQKGDFGSSTSSSRPSSS